MVNNENNSFVKIEVRSLLDWQGKGPDGCIASDKITKEGWKVGFMYREEPDRHVPDSSWRFLKGDEGDEYMNNPANHHAFSLNTICNYDNDIIPYLDMPTGTYLVRVSNDQFEIDDQSIWKCKSGWGKSSSLAVVNVLLSVF